MKYGLIPEFVGRLPVVVSLHELDQDALVRILKEPRNAIVKQYQKMLKIDDVDLEFEESALVEVAKMAIDRKTGARGLRSILENVMMEIMYEIPSRDDIKKCVVTKETILNHQMPTLVLAESKKNSEKAEESVS